jgi:hypothetical protein
MKRKKHTLKAHRVLLKYHGKLSYITHGILAKKIKVPDDLRLKYHGLLLIAPRLDPNTPWYTE